MASRSYYQIAIHHPGLNKHRVIRGGDRYLVEAAGRDIRERHCFVLPVDEK